MAKIKPNNSCSSDLGSIQHLVNAELVNIKLVFGIKVKVVDLINTYMSLESSTLGIILLLYIGLLKVSKLMLSLLQNGQEEI